MNYKIDNLQYCYWSREIFEINREAELDAVHVTMVYHEDFDEFLERVKEWELHFKNNADLIFLGKSYKDIDKAKTEKKTAIFFGFQNCSPIEDDIRLVEKVHELGCKFMQLTYNNQSLLATGCYEKIDSGVTNFGKEVIKEMNRVGIVVDMSHSAEQSTFDAIELSHKPIAITHANPLFWHKAIRNKSKELLSTLGLSGGMLGLSLYPHHLKDGTNCTWTKAKNYGEGSKGKPGFPKQPEWFKDARGFKNLGNGLIKIGFNQTEVEGILGNTWYNFHKNI